MGVNRRTKTIIKPDHQFAFHLGYERLLNEKISLTIKGGRSFRYPNIDERIGSGFISATHNFKLSSQKSLDLEFGHKFLEDNLKIITNFYYMRMLSEIKYDNATFLTEILPELIDMGLKIKLTMNLNNQFIFSNSFSITQSKYRAGHRRNFDLLVYQLLKML